MKAVKYFSETIQLSGTMANPGDIHMFRVQTPSFLISSFEVENHAEVR
jgi:hypothetical protein